MAASIFNFHLAICNKFSIFNVPSPKRLVIWNFESWLLFVICYLGIDYYAKRSETL